MSVAAIPAIANLPLIDRALPTPVHPAAPQPSGFSDLLADGLSGANAKALHAENMVRAFALDDSIPVHQVTFALEQARLQMELVMQIRGRLVEAYQQLMNMQL
jgi:flagellar hook-basal body complex protein FliE